jgi:aspartate/methionine/tyrosine aminotransferase
VQIPPFEMERWQSTWENVIELNISESGIKPLSAGELVEDPDQLQRMLSTPLAYPQSNGSEELRGNIATLYPDARADNVLVTTGTAEANFLITWSLVEPGDEVVFMMPNYMQVGGLARGFGANLKPLWLWEELRWAPNTDELRRLVTPRTRLIAVCNPNNPTGAVLTEKAMNEICEAAARAGAYVLADEVYRGAEFEGGISPTFWGRYDRVLCTAGLSKAFGLPGLRTGWMVGPEKFVQKLWGYKDYTTIGATMLSDRLAAYALSPARRDWILQRTRRILREHYPVVRDWVARHRSALRHVPPSAGAIAWIAYSGKGKSAEMAEELRMRKNVLIVPGSQFEMESYIRVGFGYDVAKLQQALGRMDDMIARVVAA